MELTAVGSTVVIVTPTPTRLRAAWIASASSCSAFSGSPAGLIAKWSPGAPSRWKVQALAPAQTEGCRDGRRESGAGTPAVCRSGKGAGPPLRGDPYRPRSGPTEA